MILDNSKRVKNRVSKLPQTLIFTDLKKKYKKIKNFSKKVLTKDIIL